MDEFRYEIPWHATRPRPGHHRSGRPGAGFEFRQHAPLAAHPDPRRLDLHASLKDPFGHPVVRVFRQRSAITVTILADLSASMAFEGQRRKMDVLADFSAATAYSAYRTGDAFSFIGADRGIVAGTWLPPSRSKGLGTLVRDRLRQFVPVGDSAQGLLEAAARVTHHRGLVFLVSDFHFPTSQLEPVLAALSRHEVVPVVIWDPAETRILRRSAPMRWAWPQWACTQWRIGVLADSETGAQRTVFIRPALQAQLLQSFKQRQEALRAVFLRHGLRPLDLSDGFDAGQVTRYFLDPYATPGTS